MFGALKRAGRILKDRESKAVPGRAKGMKTEVCFVVGLVPFSGSAGVGKRRKQGHEGRASPYFSAMLS